MNGATRIAEDVYQLRLGDVDVTVGVLCTTRGALVVDSGQYVAEGRWLRRQAERLAGGPVQGLVLTHGHWDHVHGAAGFGPDVPVFGHRDLPAYLAADPELATARAPDQLVESTRAVQVGRRQVELLHPGSGHTGHDLVVRVPGDPTVLFCGDLVEESGPPQAGEDAFPTHWPETLDRVLTAGGPDALYVPGHGAPVDAAFVQAQRDALARRFGTAPAP